VAKYCTHCKRTRDIKFFSKTKTEKDGHQYVCKQCVAIYKRAHYKKNRVKLLEQHKKYYVLHRNERILSAKNYTSKHQEQRKVYVRQWHREMCHTNINYHILQNLRRRLNHALHGALKATNTVSLLGCSIEQLKQHLEKQFKPGMTWNNYGRVGWVIDHIKPCVSFNFINPEEQKKCFHYTNLQPLWYVDNLRKGKHAR
jgi:hypothetical protein